MNCCTRKHDSPVKTGPRSSVRPTAGGLSRHPGFTFKDPLGCIAFRTVVALSVLCPLMYASEPGTDSPDEPRSRVLSNKSFTLDANRPVASSVSGETPTKPVNGKGDSVGPAGEGERKSPMPSRSRRNLRTRRAGDRGGLSSIESVPWYSTGLGALAIVLLLIGAVAFFLRRWLPAARVTDSKMLHVVGRTGLSPKHSVALIQLGRRFVMIGVSPDGMKTLCEVSDPEEAAELAILAGTSTKRESGRFDELLLGETSDYRIEYEEDSEEAESADGSSKSARKPLADLLNRLRTLKVK